jgi:hypothetical protein
VAWLTREESKKIRKRVERNPEGYFIFYFILFLNLGPFDDILTPVSDLLAKHNPDAISVVDKSYMCLLMDRVKDIQGENKYFNFYILTNVTQIMFCISVVGFFKAGISFLFTFLFIYL